MDYEVILGAEARRVIRELPRAEKKLLADGLRTELTDRPGPSTVVIQQTAPHRLPPGHTYFGHALPGYVVIYRKMTRAELAKMAREQGHVMSRGYAVFDIVPAVTPA